MCDTKGIVVGGLLHEVLPPVPAVQKVLHTYRSCHPVLAQEDAGAYWSERTLDADLVGV